MPNPEIQSLLRERIDDLSTRLLIGDTGVPASGGDPEDFLAALVEIARQAGDAGYGEAARVAQELSDGAPEMALLQDGLVRLQQALADTGSNSGPKLPAPVQAQA